MPIEVVAPRTITKYDPTFFYISELQHSELTLKNVEKYIKLVKIKCPKIVFKQFILETGWGKSNICKTCNNLFGFRNKKGYIKYKHWTESISSTDPNITGYKQFQDKKYREGYYYTFLEKIKYSESCNYVRILKLIKT
jgi:uncharacterized FlgJ-related protein